MGIINIFSYGLHHSPHPKDAWLPLVGAIFVMGGCSLVTDSYFGEGGINWKVMIIGIVCICLESFLWGVAAASYGLLFLLPLIVKIGCFHGFKVMQKSKQ